MSRTIPLATAICKSLSYIHVTETRSQVQFLLVPNNLNLVNKRNKKLTSTHASW